MSGIAERSHALPAGRRRARSRHPPLACSEGGLSGWNSHDTICGAFIAGTVNPKEEEAWDPSKRAWRWRGSSDELLSTTPIEIERYSGPIFLSHGEEDKMVTVKSTAALRQDCRQCLRDPRSGSRVGRHHPSGNPMVQPNLRRGVSEFVKAMQV